MSDEPSASGRGRLSRERVLRAALLVADGEGLPALSMRRVAEELGVETMALYRYTPSKDDLLDGLVETLFLDLEERLSAAGPAALADSPGPRSLDRAALRQSLHGIAREMYRVAVAHPNVVSLCAARTLTTPLTRRPHAVLRTHERLLVLLHAAGLDDRAALRLYRAFISWILGYLVIDLREVVDDPDEPDPAFRLGLHRLPARDFPMLRALGQELAERGGEEQLTAGVDALLDGLAAADG
ncbi:TetR/AcrR family transcriptional regulator [Streptomyces sp. PKU-EA00015]|uniref:TetR/AcrR family transcriptional regulator n=1 Tax=Streptomyces sp. PKU-EA00015 TaxID=2748326 RepID=UPI0015A04322|nr:TetR/AcrR family transcriptional regulator [Streptomyces sp. PKU-EA00015]NWF24875.1 TetR/AcrR family transcriptional regulator [Streptomyces sp. PKU-EA00015]